MLGYFTNYILAILIVINYYLCIWLHNLLLNLGFNKNNIIRFTNFHINFIIKYFISNLSIFKNLQIILLIVIILGVLMIYLFLPY